MSFQRKMQRNIWKHIGNKKGKRFFNRFPLIYANNEPKSVLARDLGDCRDNLRNSRSVFLIVGKENKEPMGQNLSFRKNNRRKKKKKPQMKKKNHLKFTNRSKKLKFEKKNYHITKNSLILAGEILCVCLVAVLLIAFFGHRVSNAGDAMSPAIENGEVVLVDRLIVDMKTPSRGTVVAFRPDGNREVHLLIRRIVGLPGETIQIKDGTVYINGKEQKKHIHVSEIKDAGIASDEIKLGKDEYFVLGDNEESGEDSRSETVGVVKADEIYGKVWFNVSSGEHFGFVKR